MERPIVSDVEVSRATGSWQPNPTATSITVKVFPIPSDDDTVPYQENTDGNLSLCYRDGRVDLDWLEYWQHYAVKTEQSTFASTTQTWQPGIFTPTPSWRDIPAELLALRQLRNNEVVVHALGHVSNGMPLGQALLRLT